MALYTNVHFFEDGGLFTKKKIIHNKSIEK